MKNKNQEWRERRKGIPQAAHRDTTTIQKMVLIGDHGDLSLSFGAENLVIDAWLREPQPPRSVTLTNAGHIVTRRTLGCNEPLGIELIAGSSEKIEIKLLQVVV
jgi:hypothetical protein